MFEPGRKGQQRAAAHPDDDLIGNLRRQRDDRRPDHRSLPSRVMKVDAVGARVGADVVHAAEEVFGWLCALCAAPLASTVAQQPVISNASWPMRRKRRMLVTPRSTHAVSSPSSRRRCSVCHACQPWPTGNGASSRRSSASAATGVISWHAYCAASNAARGPPAALRCSGLRFAQAPVVCFGIRFLVSRGGGRRASEQRLVRWATRNRGHFTSRTDSWADPIKAIM